MRGAPNARQDVVAGRPSSVPKTARAGATASELAHGITASKEMSLARLPLELYVQTVSASLPPVPQ